MRRHRRPKAPSITRETAGEDTPRWVVWSPDGQYLGEASRLPTAQDIARDWAEKANEIRDL